VDLILREHSLVLNIQTSFLYNYFTVIPSFVLSSSIASFCEICYQKHVVLFLNILHDQTIKFLKHTRWWVSILFFIANLNYKIPKKISIIRHFIKVFQSDTEVLINNWSVILVQQQQLTTLVSWQISRSHNYMTQPVSSSSFNTPTSRQLSSNQTSYICIQAGLFYSRDTFLKNVAQIEHKIPI